MFLHVITKYPIWILLLIGIHQIKGNGEKSITVDIHPGFGWNNLRFMEMSPIFDVSDFNNSNVFQSCIEMIPVHQNRIELGSTTIDLFDARTTDYSSNLFIDGKAGYYGFKIGGSYSNEFQRAKKEQGTERTIMLRNQIDYVMVDIILQSSCPLNPQAKKALLDIAKYQTAEESTMPIYAAQLFVKKYGTHYTTRLHLGGSISEEDFILESAYQSSETEKSTYRAAAEASFLGTFSISAKFATESTNTDATLSAYKKKITRKIVNSKGGKVSLLGQQMENWQSTIAERPTITQRAIENITFFIQSDKIPELSEVDLAHVRERINEAVEAYIQMNVISGCMERTSPSFNWLANVGDSSCAPVQENTQFGGFIRTCSEDTGLFQ